ncbi:hypothetical protein TNCV_684591 [Trichonephila clavipes]|nr:hypothetical protein TNCV_684591 [Trichonephila clavipes]
MTIGPEHIEDHVFKKPDVDRDLNSHPGKGWGGEFEKRDLERDLERAETSRDQTRRPKGIFSDERRNHERRWRWRTGNNVGELNKCPSDKGLK